MKDLFEAINTRVKEPYWGFFLLSFLAFNWRGLFLLFFATGTAQERIVLFDSQTNFLGLLFLPIATSVVILLITPWLKVIFGYATRSAYERINSQELKRESKYLSEKNALEQERAKELANKENELIDQAKRDIDIKKIEDEDVKNSLKREIENLRNERNEIIHKVNLGSTKKNDIDLNEFEKEILNYLSLNNENFIQCGHDFQFGLFIEIYKKNIFKNSDTRKFLKYEEAIKSLTTRKIIYDLGGESKIYELTEFGRELISNSELV